MKAQYMIFFIYGLNRTKEGLEDLFDPPQQGGFIRDWK